MTQDESRAVGIFEQSMIAQGPEKYAESLTRQIEYNGYVAVHNEDGSVFLEYPPSNYFPTYNQPKWQQKFATLVEARNWAIGNTSRHGYKYTHPVNPLRPKKYQEPPSPPTATGLMMQGVFGMIGKVLLVIGWTVVFVVVAIVTLPFFFGVNWAISGLTGSFTGWIILFLLFEALDRKK